MQTTNLTLTNTRPFAHHASPLTPLFGALLDETLFCCEAKQDYTISIQSTNLRPCIQQATPLTPLFGAL